MCDQKVWSSAEKTSVPCGTTAGLCERCDLYDAADSDAARITALEAQLAAAEARADKAEGFRDGCTSTDPCGGCARCVTETLGWRDAAWAERDALRADLARVTAERDASERLLAEARGEIAGLDRAAASQVAALASARQEAEGLRKQADRAQRLFADLHDTDALAEWACQSVPGEESFRHQVSEMITDLDAVTGLAARQRAAFALLPTQGERHAPE